MPNRHEMKQIPGRRARQGEIVLKSPTSRIIFIAGLVGIVILALIVSIAA